MNSSESIKELACAFAKAQSEFVGAVKDSSNPFFKSKYADLESVVGAIKPALTKHGLSFVQISHNDQAAAAIETIILHSSGEWLSAGIVSVPVSKNDAQGFGSAMTYARRYSLSAAFGIAPEDDDGNAAAKAKPGVHKPTDNQAFNPDEEEVKFLSGIIADIIALENDPAVASEKFYGSGLDNDEKIYVWNALGQYSTLRRKIKEHHADVNQIKEKK